MTILEKARKKYPDITGTDIKERCPSDYGFKDCMLEDGDILFKCSMTCEECWHREYDGGNGWEKY